MGNGFFDFACFQVCGINVFIRESGAWHDVSVYVGVSAAYFRLLELHCYEEGDGSHRDGVSSQDRCYHDASP